MLDFKRITVNNICYMAILDPKKISTQEHLDIEEIRDNLVILKNGKVASVVETSALNFDLLDSKEQDARIYSFAAFLNSILFPIQIVIRTQRTDVAKYLNLLESYKAKINSKDVKNQIEIYQGFISNLTQTTQILDKRFFTIIPSQKLNVVSNSWIRQAFGKSKKIINIKEIIKKAKEELDPKTDQIIKQFANLGVSAKQLETDELIKLYYSVYEPDRAGIDVLNLKATDINQEMIGT